MLILLLNTIPLGNWFDLHSAWFFNGKTSTCFLIVIDLWVLENTVALNAPESPSDSGVVTGSAWRQAL